MQDALLYAVRDAILGGGFGYDESSCEVMADGQPPARCGKLFVAVHQADSRPGPDNDNSLQEYFGFTVTVTIRAVAPPDRIGNSEIAVRQADRKGLNRRLEELRAFLHMNWGVLQDANNNLAAWATETTGTVYGFCEPARYRGCSKPRLVGADWFSAAPGGKQQFGVAADLTFADCRRMQAIAVYV
jgi:hypothetical protein